MAAATTQNTTPRNPRSNWILHKNNNGNNKNNVTAAQVADSALVAAALRPRGGLVVEGAVIGGLAFAVLMLFLATLRFGTRDLR